MLTSELNPDVGDSPSWTQYERDDDILDRVHNRQDETWGATRIKRTPFLCSIAREIE